MLSEHPIIRALIAAVLVVLALLVMRAEIIPDPDSTNAPPPVWLLRVLGVAILLFAIGVCMPQRIAPLVFTAGFLLSTAMVLWIPFNPGELHGTISLLTPVGFFEWRMGDRATRMTSVAVAVFVVGAVLILVGSVLKDRFGSRRAFDGTLGVGLLLVLPFLFGLIAICLVLLSPAMIWRAIEDRRARSASRKE